VIFRRWRDNALVKDFLDGLRMRAREKPGRDAEPSAGDRLAVGQGGRPPSATTAEATTAPADQRPLS
jgi:hypothetical protein